MSSLYAQIEEGEEYYLNFPFEEGIYLSFEEFKENAPSMKNAYEKRGDDLYVKEDSSEKFIRVDPDKVWGYSSGGNVYIALEDGFWRFIRIGALSHFTAVILVQFQTVDNFGFPVTQQSRSLRHMFLDFESGDVFELTSKNVEPFIEKEPLLHKKYEKFKKIRTPELIQIIQAYNEIHPIRFPTAY